MLESTRQIVVEKVQFRMAWGELVDAGGAMHIAAHAGTTTDARAEQNSRPSCDP